MDSAVERLILIGATALLYSPGALEEQRQAAFDSILYAQLVANKNVGSRFAEYERWYAAYLDAYSKLGWIKLAGTHDVKQLGQPLAHAQTQPLEGWLRMRSICQEGVLAAIRAGLGHSAEGLSHLLKFGIQAQSQHSTLVLELGLLKPGPTLDLCSVTMQLDKPISAISPDVLLDEAVLGGEAEFTAVSLALNNAFFQNRRDELQALMHTKNAEGHYRFDPHALPAGAQHE
ncbi:hypothetical protein [Pseudomonas sp. NBRC 111124]|uniref:hypothetical protein n=1 Tax=Pseudomonas sp. NBRC 111124 TaxID=1661039 RepID=UPI0007615C93|nr:hypothetical protein [Pseudomonas sp. NBRC 111124]